MPLIYHALAFVDEQSDVPSLLVKMHQLFLLDGKVRLILVRVVNVAFQVDDIFQGGECNFAEHSLYIAQVAVFPSWVVLAEVILDGVVQRVNTFLHAGHVDFLIYLQHFLEER